MKRRQLVAAGVTTLGVVLIWAFATLRQQDSTEEAARRWAGEQWDIARRCLVGTPIGRRDAEEAIADRLAANLLDALLDAELEGTRDEDAPRWPARCAPLLRRLDVAPSVTGGADLSRPLGELAGLTRHALDPDDLAGSLARARELAGPIHVLDGAMPPGAEYDPARYPPPRTDPGPIEASLRCNEAAHERRPRSELAADCGERPFAPAPPDAPLVWACDETRSLVLFRDGPTWRGTSCEGDDCRPAPPLEAGGDLQLALSEHGVVAVATGSRSALPLARVGAADGWSAPVPVARGRLAEDGAAIVGCGERWTFSVPTGLNSD